MAIAGVAPDSHSPLLALSDGVASLYRG